MFRKRKPVRQLSADELKSKLYAHFHKSGTLNKMRTELRGKLITELFKISAPIDSTDGDEAAANFDRTLLPLQVSNWLVYDYLLKQGYQYALSTFVTEANLPHPEGLLTACDILSLFGLNSSTPEYMNISKMYSCNNEQGISHSLLLAVIKSLLDFSNRDDNVQKNPNEKDSIDISLEEPTRNLSLSNKVELSQYPNTQEFLGSSVNRLDKYTDSSIHEQLNYVKEQKDREIQALRQKLVQEVERLHFQEGKMRFEIENERRELKRKLDAIDIEKEKFKERELLLNKEHENKLEKNLRALEVDFVSKIHTKEKELEISQGKLYEKEARLSQVEADYSSLQGSYNSLRKELEEIRQSYSTLLDENTNLLRKFENMSDYTNLKGNLEITSKEVTSLQKDLESFRIHARKEKESLLEKVRSLEMKLKVKESQLSEAQRQLNLTKDTLHMEETTWHRERKRLEQESQASKEMYKTLIQRLEEQKDDIHALHQTIHILHYQLTDTDKRNQSKTETFIPYRTKIKMPEISRSEPEIFRINNTVKDSLAKYKDSLKFIEEAKDRISKLQQESNKWQDKSSMVYCSLPGIQDSSSSQNINVFNAASYLDQKFKAQPYKSRFENLIKNEMPTLDLNVPFYLKTQLVDSLSSTYSPKNSSLTTQTASVKHSSDSVQQKSTSSNREVNEEYIIGVDGLQTLKPRQTNIVEKGKIRNNYEDTINTLQNLQQVADMTSFPSRSFETLDNEKSEEIHSEMPHPQGKIKHVSTKKNEGTHNLAVGNKEKENEYKFQSHKLSSEELNLDSSVKIQLDSQMNNKSTDALTVQSDSNQSKIPASGDEFRIDKNTNIEVDLDAAWKQKALLKDTPETQPVLPVLVDLDSVWKRKSSLKGDSESQPVPPILANLDSAWKRKTSMMSLTNSLFQGNLLTSSDQSNVESDEKATFKKTTDSKEDKNKDFSENKLESPQVASIMPDSKKGDDKISEGILLQEKNTEIPEGIQSSLKQSVFEPQVESKTSVSEPSLIENSEKINKDTKDYKDSVEKDCLADSKKLPEDSLSELSEVHLSCGSEQEQQKEDSDNW